MIIGVPKEIKQDETRVALTPSGVRTLVRGGNEVLVESGAGDASGFTNAEYLEAGAKVIDQAGDVWGTAEMIVKVKEPLAKEFPLFREGQIMFTYLHLAAAPELTRALMDKSIVAVAYETVQLDNGLLPLLVPMSEVAGRMSVQIGARLMENAFGGNGVLLGGLPGVAPAEVVIIGGGIVGTNAARIALGLGAQVALFDINPERLRYLDDLFAGRVATIMSSPDSIREYVRRADLLIGAVLIPGARAPRLVSAAMVREMKPGSVIVDVAIDQGGCVETCDHTTSHSDPTYSCYDVVHYAVPNIPAAVGRTATLALTNSTLPYIVRMARDGYAGAIRSDAALARGVNVINGTVTNQGVAGALGLPCGPLH